MNSLVKYVIIFLNIIVLFIGILWYNNPNGNYEPLSFIILQTITLFTIFFETKISRIVTKKIKNSEIDITANSSQDITAKKIIDSKIRIKAK